MYKRVTRLKLTKRKHEDWLATVRNVCKKFPTCRWISLARKMLRQAEHAVKPGVSNSNCTEGQMRTYKVNRGPHYSYSRAALWRWHNNGGTWTLLESFYILFPATSIMSYRQIVSCRLYLLLKGTCSLASRTLLNTGE